MPGIQGLNASAGPRPRRSKRSAVVFAVACLVSAALIVVSLASASFASPRIPGPAVHVNIIGDSLSTGLMTPGDTWPDQAQEMLSASGFKAAITNTSENGAGYVQRGASGNKFLDLVNRSVTSQSRLVVIFGSDNDAGQSGLAGAVGQVLARVAQLAPHAVVIVVGPTSESDDAQGDLAPIRQTLAQAAAAAGAQFVDPVALGWFQGGDAQYLAGDMEHPNTAGEIYLAQHLSGIMEPYVKTVLNRRALEHATEAKVVP